MNKQKTRVPIIRSATPFLCCVYGGAGSKRIPLAASIDLKNLLYSPRPLLHPNLLMSYPQLSSLVWKCWNTLTHLVLEEVDRWVSYVVIDEDIEMRCSSCRLGCKRSTRIRMNELERCRCTLDWYAYDLPLVLGLDANLADGSVMHVSID